MQLNWTLGGESVIVTGNFDDWTKSIICEKSNRGHVGILELKKPQKIIFKFIIDGEWKTSPYYPTEMDSQVNKFYTGKLE